MTTAPVVTITAELLAELKQKAEAATSGPWSIHRQASWPFELSLAGVSGEFITDVRLAEWSTADDIDAVNARPGNRQVFADAAHIAAANPATILALIATIRELTAAVPRWISVDDRLPVDGDEVIVSGWAYNDPAQGRYVSAAIFRDGGFHPMDAQDDYDNLHPVTHWMPLPAAPAIAQEGADHE